MARISSTPKTSTYHALSEAAASINETNDCSVKAVATVTGCDYLVAHAELKKQGRKDRDGAFNHHIIEAVEALGYGAKRVSPRDFISRYPGRNKNLKSVTSHHPDRFNKVWADGKTYLLFTRHHVLAVVNGVNHDWSRDRAKRARMILEIIKT